VRQVGLLVRLLMIVVCLALVQEPRALTAADAVNRGDTALRQGQTAQAAMEYRLALEAQPGDAAILARLVD